MQLVPIEQVKLNGQNPRTIDDGKFEKLVQSLRDLPEMAKVRPLIVNKDMVVLGGNMRLRAMASLNWPEVPVEVVDWPADKQQEFIIKDNVSFGDWNFDELYNQFETEMLEEWGLELPEIDFGPQDKDSQPRLDEKKKVTCPECGHEFEN